METLNPRIFLLITCFSIFNLLSQGALPAHETNDPHQEITLYDTLTTAFLKKNINKESPRIIFTPEKIKIVREKTKNDSLCSHIYKLIKKKANLERQESVLERQMTGRRLLHISRAFLSRVNTFATPYIIEKDTTYLKRLNEEILAVASFKDWNPEHFLDAAEILMGMSLALDWTAGMLPDSTIRIAKQAIIQKGLQPGLDTTNPHNWWHQTDNNWNQVCHGGMIAGAIAVFEDYPELATKVINFSTKQLPLALRSYAPDGVYPEGASYWEYGTSYSVLTSAILESTFGTDFGLKNHDGFMQSPVFVLKCIAPSGQYYNFSDCGDKPGIHPYYLMTWFAYQTGNKSFLKKKELMNKNTKPEHIPRINTPVLLWLADFTEKENTVIPNNWKGDGVNPVVVFNSDTNDFYFACKGGSANLNHANMDVGSFIFETEKTRWSIDPGNQNYHELEKTGFNLWDKAQKSERWELITKNNFGHSTLTINKELHLVNGRGKVIDFIDNANPSVSIDMSSVFGDNATSVLRKFQKMNHSSIRIIDKIETNENTKSITWQMITTADARVEKNKVLLTQKGENMELKTVSHPNAKINIINLNPPPHFLDKKVEHLKRIEFVLDGKQLTKHVTLSIVLQENNDH